MEETCSECAFDESLAQPADVALALPSLAAAIGEDIRALSAELARRRPAPDVWSPVGNTLGTCGKRWPSIAG